MSSTDNSFSAGQEQSAANVAGAASKPMSSQVNTVCGCVCVCYSVLIYHIKGIVHLVCMCTQVFLHNQFSGCYIVALEHCTQVFIL